MNKAIGGSTASQHCKGQAMDIDDAKYLRVTNLGAQLVNLSLQVAGGVDGTPNMSTTLLLAAGRSFVMGAVNEGIALSDANADIVATLTDLESILIDPVGNAVTVEIFIAS